MSYWSELDFAERLAHGDTWDPVSATWAYDRASRAKKNRGDGGAFGRTVRYRREQRELTQAELAERTGLDQGTVGNVERGTRQTTLGVALALSDALGMGLREHLAGYAPPYD